MNITNENANSNRIIRLRNTQSNFPCPESFTFMTEKFVTTKIKKQ